MSSNKTELDFTELLDDLLAASLQDEEEDSSSPSLRIDLLDQIERLQSHGRPLFTRQAFHAYSTNAAGELSRNKAARNAVAPDLEPALDDLFFLDPQTISRELGIIDKSRPEELDRARRAFAMRYHPDRMPEEQRERAAMRMQIANMLIDEAKRRRR